MVQWPGREITGPTAAIQRNQQSLRPPLRAPVPRGSNAPALMAPPPLTGPGQRAASLDRNRQRERNSANLPLSLSDMRGEAAYHPERTAAALQTAGQELTGLPSIARGAGALTGFGMRAARGDVDPQNYGQAGGIL